MPRKIVSAQDAARLIHSGQTITTSGFVGCGVPEALLAALADRFRETQQPRDLTLLFAAGQGNGAEQGLNRLAEDGLLKRVIGGHWGLIPKVAAMAIEGKIEAYNLPQGCISALYREIAAHRPGLITRVGLDTFVDPALEGGKVNSQASEDIVERIDFAGEPHLFYKAQPIDVALLRGTTADEIGNISMEREALVLDNLAQAMAAKNSGGVVIVQVERIAAARSLSPRSVIIPSALVDAVVVAPPELHRQTYATAYSPAFAGELREPAEPVAATKTEEGAGAVDLRRIIARRAAFELPVNGVVNLGIGMPEGVAAVAAEEGLLPHLTLTAEPGVLGGQPASGLDFGAAVNTDAIIAQNAQFDFYDGGGLDLACLGMAEVDATGSVNVSRFGPRLAGAGGFINISQNARRVAFTGAFSSGGLTAEVANGKLTIAQEGRALKFVEAVQQVTFSGPRAVATAKPVLFITERCVFELTPEGVRLTEVAPGVDVDRNILAGMGFAPLVGDVIEMDPRIFLPGPMGLRTDLLHLDLEERIALDGEGGVLFINFEKLRVRSAEDIERIAARVEQVCAPLGRRVDVIVNYDGSRIDEEVERAYWEMVHGLEARFYDRVTRYSSAAFMRMKLGAASRETGRDAHVFETRAQARDYLRNRSRA